MFKFNLFHTSSLLIISIHDGLEFFYNNEYIPNASILSLSALLYVQISQPYNIVLNTQVLKISSFVA